MTELGKRALWLFEHADMNTHDIGVHLKFPEHIICNAIRNARDERRRQASYAERRKIKGYA